MATAEPLKVNKHCNRCGHVMWFEESTNRWWCTNKKCKKYKEQPQTEPEEQTEEETK